MTKIPDYTTENCMADLFALSFTVPGKPFGKQTSRSASNGRHYTTDKTRFYEGLVATMAMRAMQEARYCEPCTKSLCLVFTANFPIPVSWSVKKRADAISGMIMPVVKPDLSNIQKAIEDGMNGVVYKDDSQIVYCRSHKIYTENPCVKIELRQWES